MGGEVLLIQADLSDPAARVGIVDKAVAYYGRLDILVNNAAWLQYKPNWEFQTKHIHLAFQINVDAAHDLSREAYPHMKSQGAGWILNLRSATAVNPTSAPYDPKDRYTAYNRDHGIMVYGTTKAALNRLTTGWAVEVASAGLSVNSLAPVAAVASEGALALGGFDLGKDMEPQETMAESALQLCHRPVDTQTGRIARSIHLLKELCVATKSLDGTQVVKDYDFSGE